MIFFVKCCKAAFREQQDHLFFKKKKAKHASRYKLPNIPQTETQSFVRLEI